MPSSILVTGATGNQGGAVIKALLNSPNFSSSDITIYALTRNPDSPGAKALVEKDSKAIRLLKGDLSDPVAIFKGAPDTINSVFCVTIPNFSGAEKEEVQSKAFIDAAVENGVEHFVLTSVDRHGADSDTNDTNVPHFKSKANVERHLKEKSTSSNISWTILRPVAFMENIQPGFMGTIFGTAWKIALPPTTKIQLISTEDIGYFGAQALLKPKEYHARAISLAGDELTFAEGDKVFREVTGKPIPTTFGFIVRFLLWAVNDVGEMFRWFADVGYAADVQALRQEYRGLRSFKDWVETSPFAPSHH
ncbi:hypothetical protein B7463_g3655, partial [Scytalidium lignicola]